MSSAPKYYQMGFEDLEDYLKTDLKNGLSEARASQVLESDGKNSLGVKKKKTLFDMAIDELKSPLAFTLLVAGILTTFMAHYVDATVIFVALIINTLINLYQNNSASRAFDALKNGTPKQTIVIRDGLAKQINTEDVVRGDIIMLQTGNSVPADARIIDSCNAEVNESTLTGEWLPITKHSALIGGVLTYIEQKNMIFAGTLIAMGTIRAVVVETGERTVFGKIGNALKEENETKTPMQENIAAIAKLLMYIIFGCLVVVFVISLIKGVGLVDSLMMLVAIGVAAIPEGLPAAVSVILAFSMQRILKKGGLVRNMLAAETLGSTTVIMTDKTGTLTEGIMHVDRIICHSSLDDAGVIYSSHKRHEEHGDERDALGFAYLASNVIIEENVGALKEPAFHGLPVEVAVVKAFYSSGISEKEIEKDFKRIAMLPFSSDARMVFSLNDLHGLKHNRLFALGAAEEVLRHAKSYYADGVSHEMKEGDREKFERIINKAAGDGVRVVAVGYVDTQKEEIGESWEDVHKNFFEHGNFVFCGIIYLADPIRPDVRRSISIAKKAGIRVIMTTGDNPKTALVYALQTGIVHDKDSIVITGREIDEMGEDKLKEALQHVNVFARVLPEHKQRIAQILSEKGEVVAMTGDGVNDAPALNSAAIGVALGSGTDIAKEASDLVLVNNSFSVIVSAIEEGRRAVDNMRKSVAYLLSTSFSEVVLVVTSLMIGSALPLLPVQIIWTNMLTEGFMNFSFAFEKSEDGIMTRNPKTHGAQNMLNRKFISFIITVGIITSIIFISVYLIIQNQGLSGGDVRTIMFVVLTLITSFISLSLRDLHNPIWQNRPWSNKYLMISLVLTMSGLAIALFVPVFTKLLSLNTSAIMAHIYLIVSSVVIMFIGVESAKFVMLKKN